MQENGDQSLNRNNSLEKGMALHSSVLAWKIPGQRSLEGYSPWGHKESDMIQQLTHTHTHSLGRPGGIQVRKRPSSIILPLIPNFTLAFDVAVWLLSHV